MTMPSRDAGLDALRAAMTLLVLFHHSAITYGALGGWNYREVVLDDRLETKLLIFFCTVNQAFFMGLFFLIAGFLTPGAIARHGPLPYLRDRLRRLGLPLLAYIGLIGPATIALAQTAQGRPFLPNLLRLWRIGVFDDGPLWFALALLLFSVAALAWRAVSPPGAPAFPGHRTLTATAIGTGLAAFALRLVWPVGWTIAGLQLGYFASYIVLFGAGVLGAGQDWLSRVPAATARIWWRVALVTLPVLPALVLLAPAVPVLQGDTSGGWNIQALVYALWEPLVAWGTIMMLLRRFAARFQRLGPIWSALARRAFAIYVIHPPVLVAIALAWRAVTAPHLVKFALTGSATCVTCFVLAGLLLRVPGLRRSL